MVFNATFNNISII